MDFLEFVTTRQSVRAFDTERPVEKEKLNGSSEAARLAPSACNAQPWHLIVVDEPELKNKVADATSARALGMNHFTKQAPVHIVLVEEKVNLTSGVGVGKAEGLRRWISVLSPRTSSWLPTPKGWAPVSWVGLTSQK